MASVSTKEVKDTSHWLLFLVMPFFAGIKAMQNFRAPWAKNVLWAFVVFFGYTFAIGKETRENNEDAGGDINRYINELKELYAKPMDFQSAVSYFQESGEADVLRTIIAVVVSRFTDSSNILIAVYAFIFGYFFSRNLWYLLSRVKGKLKVFSIFLFATFFLLDSFWEINGFRFNTAIHIFIFGMLPYLFEGKKRYIWVSVLSILVHFTFLFPVSILFIYLVLGNRSVFYFVFFILSTFAKEINIAAFNQFIETNAPEAFIERSSTYRDEESVSEYRGEKAPDEVVAQKNWYAVWYVTLMQRSIIVILIFMFFFSLKKIKAIKGLYSIFCFVLLFFAISNLLSSLPSGGRFLTIASMLAVTTIFFYIQNFSSERYMKNILLVTMPAFALFILVSVRVGLYSIGINTIVGNPFLVLFTDYNLSINDIIK